MTMTKEDLQLRFDEYNQLYFDGKLKSVNLGFLSKSFKTIVGIFEFEIDKNRRVKNPSIKVSKRIDWDEEKLKSVLLHEMAHLSVTQKYKKGAVAASIQRLRSHGIRDRKNEGRSKPHIIFIFQKPRRIRFSYARCSPPLSLFSIFLSP